MSDLMGSLGLGQVLGDSTVGQYPWFGWGYSWQVRHDLINNVYRVYRFVRHPDNIMYLDKEVHEFQTEEYAQWFADFCNRLEFKKPRIGLFSWSFLKSEYPCEYVSEFDKAGHLSKFDLPEIIRIWIKRSILGRGLKALWYGWGKP